jgi:hypothetical protein
MEINEQTFDCIALKRKAQMEIYETIKNLSPDEEIAYFRRRAKNGPYAELWEKLGWQKVRM